MQLRKDEKNATEIFDNMIKLLGPMNGKENLEHGMLWHKFYNWTTPPAMVGEVEFVNVTKFTCKFLTKILEAPDVLFYSCLWCANRSHLEYYQYFAPPETREESS